MKYFLIPLLIIFQFCCRQQESNNAEKSTGKNGKIIKSINDDELKRIINNRNGKILLVNVWATWCKPCVKEFPDIVKITGEYENKKMDFLSLNVDFGKHADSLVADFLSRQNNPGFMVYIVPEKKTEQVIELLNKNWDGSIPATFIYDSTGEQKSFLLGSQDYIAFKKSIENILNRKI
ncbi:MAG TPA: TlpA disulfide reductase family protein [Ignavibacteriaceae bacterium]|nr:TlpA disulfide reductase family protein [Ignavibacteriaceae bacterium]